MIITTATIASKGIPVIIKATKIAIQLLSVAVGAKPYVNKAIEKSRGEHPVHASGRKLSIRA